MSTTIDERVVEMRFDNKQFESNVATSMSTLEKLKQKLNLSGASKGLEDVNAAAKRVDMSPLGNAVESIKVKFSALDVVAVTALANITNSAVNTGKRLISSLSVDQVKEGWKKFSDKTTSVATLVAQGNAIEDVNKQLDRLNWFTDETSYNFTDMVANIAKFTATGKGLNESVTAMEGVATWAALSGQNAATASRAMYQLSQAMGAGVMRLEDYKSIQNASMDTEEFRQKCIDAAIELGTLEEVSEGTYQSLVATGKGAESFNISQFTTKLTDGAWMTSEVMMKVFNDYSAAVDGIYEAAEEKGMLASKVIDEIYETAESGGISVDEAIQKLGYSFNSFALKAFEAAQKARTFGDAIDSVKDAVSTGWMNTFELIFGDAEQATKLWTDVANQLYDVFAAGGERRNEILESAMTSKWDTLIKRVKKAGVETDKFEQTIAECAEAGGIDVDKITDKYGSLSEAFKQGAINVKYLKEAVDLFNGTASETEKTVETIKGLSVDFTDIFPGKYGETTVAWGSDAVESVKKVQTALTELGYELPKYGIDGIFENETWRAVADFQRDAGLAVTGIVDQATIDAMIKAGESLERVADATGEVGEASAKSKIEVDDLVDGINKMSGQELVFGAIHNVLEGIVGILNAFRDAWAEIFPVEEVASGLHSFLTSIYSVTDGFTNFIEKNANKIKSTFKGVIAVFDILTSIVGGAFKAAFDIIGAVFSVFSGDILRVTGNIGNVIAAFRDWIVENEIVATVFGKVVDGVNAVINVVKGWIQAFKEIPAVSKFLFKVKRRFSQFVLSAKDMDRAMKRLKKRFEEFKNSDFVQNILTKIQAAFKTISEDCIPKAIKALGEWFEKFKQTPGVQKLISAVESLISAFKELFNGKIDASEFATKLGDGLGRLLASIPAIAGQIASDFFAGFTNGLGAGVSGVITSIVNFCKNFIAAFAAALGIASPSTIAYADGVYFVEGFSNGVKEKTGSVLDVLKGICAKIVEFFKGLWEKASTIIAKIDWKKVFAGAMLVGALWFLKKIGDFFGSLSGLLDSIGGVFDSVSDVIKTFGKVLKSFSKVLDGIAWDFKAKALLKMAIALGILVAAVLALVKFAGDDYLKLWNAVGVILALSLILVGLAAAMNKLGSASISFERGKGFNIDGLKTTILQIGIAIALLAFAVKILGSIPDTEAKAGLKRLGAILVGMIVFIAILGGISRYAGDVSGIAAMMTKMAIAIGLMALVCKLIGTLSEDEIGKGLAFIGALMLFTTGLTAVAKSAGNNVNKVGGMMIKLAVAMGLMILVCKLVGRLSEDEMIKGGVFLAAFLGFVWLLVKATKIGKKQQIAQLSGLLMSISLAMILMVGVCKLVGRLSEDEMIKGGVFLAAFLGFVWLLVKATTLAPKQKIAEVSATLLAMAVAVGILAAVCIALSFVDPVSLAKGVVAVVFLSGMMALMVHSLKGAKNAKGAIMMMAVVIGVLAAALYVLSTLDTTKMLTSAAALAAVMATFALMVSTLKKLDAKQALKGALALLALMVPIAAFAGILHHMGDVNDLITKVVCLTGAIAAMSGLLLVLKIVGGAAPEALKGVGLLLLMMVPLVAFVGILHLLNGIDEFESKIIALCAGMAALVVLLGLVTIIGLGALASLAGMAALLIFVGEIALIVTIVNAIGGIATAALKAKLLYKAMEPFIELLAVLSIIGFAAPAALAGIVSLLALVGSLAVIGGELAIVGAIVDKWPQIADKIESGTKVLIKVADGLGSIIGTFLSSLGKAVTAGFVDMAENVSTCMGKLAEASEKAAKIDGKSFEGVADVMKVLVDIGKTSTKVTKSDLFSRIFDSEHRDSITKFGDDGVAFFNSMKRIGDSVSGVNLNSYAMSTVIKFANELVKLRSSLPQITSFGEWVTSEQNSKILENFGADCEKFIGSMVQAFGALKDDKGNNLSLNTWGMTNILKAAESLAGIQTQLRTAVEKIQTFDGYTAQLVQDTSLGTFGENCEIFIESMVAAFEMLKTEDGMNIQLNTTAMNTIVSIGNQLAAIQATLQEPITQIEEFDKYSFELVSKTTTLTTFGENCKAFVGSIKAAFDMLKDDKGNNVQLNTTAMDTIVKIGNQLADIQTKLQTPITQIEKFNNYSYRLVAYANLAVFGENCLSFVTSMKAAFDMLKVADANGNPTSEDTTLNTTAMDQIITAAGKLADLQARLEGAVGQINTFGDYLTNVFKDNENLTNFGENCKSFIASMTTAFDGLKVQSGANEGTDKTLNTTAMDGIIAAATKLVTLQDTLGPVKSFIGWFDGTNKQDLGDFGDNISAFATAMTEFSTAGSDFNTTCAENIIASANSLATFVDTINEIDFDNLNNLTGDGTLGGLGQGAIGKIASAMANFGNIVSEIDASKVSAAASAAVRLKNLINDLSGLNITGVEKFKPEVIGEKISDYYSSISGIDTVKISSSISAAIRIRNLISNLSGLDTTGAEKFKPDAVGDAIKKYSAAVSGIDLAAITNSIAAGNKIKNFISSLPGLNTNGVSSFRSAVSELSQVNFNGIGEMAAGYAEAMQASGQALMSNLGTGIQVGLDAVLPTIDAAINKVIARIRSKANAFRSAGIQLAQRLGVGFSSYSGRVASMAGSAASKAVSNVRSYYSSFFNAGEYLVRGFANGITLYTYIAENAAKQMAKKAKEAADKELDINSPSKVFKQIGASVVEGFALGIDVNGDEVENSAKAMAAKAINTTRGAMAAVLDTLNSDLDSQPTIRPVVDLSDVRTGADAISGMFDGIQTVGVRSNLNAINMAMNDKLQNGSNSDVISAINKLGDGLENARGDTYNFGGFTYDDGSNVSDAVGTLIRYARIGRRR